MFKATTYGFVMSFFVITGLLSGCDSTPALQTSTGKPEVTISGATKQAVFDKLAEEMLSIDYMLKSRTPNIVIFGKQIGSIKAWRTGEYVNGENRVTYNFIDTSDGIRIMATIGEYSNPDTPIEYLEDDMSKDWRGVFIQDILVSVKDKVEQIPAAIPAETSPAATPTPLPVQAAPSEDVRIVIDMVGMIIKGNAVQSIIADGPAEKAGIKKGDIILIIDGEPAGTSQLNAAKLNGKADTAVLLKIKRGDEELTITLIRENP